MERFYQQGVRLSEFSPIRLPEKWLIEVAAW